MKTHQALKGRHNWELIRWSDSKDEPGEEETADVETADPPEAKPKDATDAAKLPEPSEAAPKMLRAAL
ncbi:MAG: hypothetical protein QGG36_14760 [Pirellulaceae bacterium]|jgi:hypothetical protein|nr:hypothetical protein [Pirellulaceae bacterium]